MKYFNTAGKCRRNKHYMVDLSPQIARVLQMVDRSQYFCINRGRQYGKTTLINSFCPLLEKKYAVFSISFEALGDDCYRNEKDFAAAFIGLLYRELDGASSKNLSHAVRQYISIAYGNKEYVSFEYLIDFIRKICRDNPLPIVLIIDEVDQASSYQVFVRFLGLLRNMYLGNDEKVIFQSVILASVYDVKNLKLKLRPDEEHRYNSPWNIAVPFNVDMSLSEDGIRDMLGEYSRDHGIEFDTAGMAREIRAYTDGYPFLVSRICQLLDEEKLGWNREGLLAAVRIILTESNTLFDDLNKKINDFPKMKAMLQDILYNGSRQIFNIDIPEIELAYMFSFIKNNGGQVAIANRIFETRLYNRFIQEDGEGHEIFRLGSSLQNGMIQGGILNMDRVLEKFVEYYTEIYGQDDHVFLEKMGRKLFLLFLRPIINGAGNYYIEAQTRDERRTDIIVDYSGRQYIIEMKIWHGDAYNEAGEKQLVEYLDYYHQDKGYLVSFCFNKNKKSGVMRRTVNGKLLIEAIV